MIMNTAKDTGAATCRSDPQLTGSPGAQVEAAVQALQTCGASSAEHRSATFFLATFAVDQSTSRGNGAMGRRQGLGHVAVLLLFALSAAPSLLGGCGDKTQAPVRATVAELVADQEGYDGRRVETAGLVRRFGAAEGATRLHYVVEDQQANRVAIIPNDIAERYTGQEVTVVGSFRFSEQEGRSIEIERIDRR